MDCVQVKLYKNNFGGTELKRNYIWGYKNKKEKVEYHWNILSQVFSDSSLQIFPLLFP
jgi:hypothetical protein